MSLNQMQKTIAKMGVCLALLSISGYSIYAGCNGQAGTDTGPNTVNDPLSCTQTVYPASCSCGAPVNARHATGLARLDLFCGLRGVTTRSGQGKVSS